MKNKQQDLATLWHWTELEDACNLTRSNVNRKVSGISIDSRSVTEGDLFIALSGDPGPGFTSSGSQGMDGHDFVAQAKQKGAVGLMVSRPVSSTLPMLRVANTLNGLWQLGSAARNRMSGKVVAITGSSGKTTLRQWTEQVLSEQAMTHASIGSFNNHWGVPLSLARMPRQSDYGIFEVGMNHPGEISPLATLVKPDVAVVLNVLPAHIGQFESLEHIRKEKLSIKDGLVPTGTLVLPDDIATEELGIDKIVTFGFAEHALVKGKIVSDTTQLDKTRVEVMIEDTCYVYTLDGRGEHRVLTSLALMAIVHSLGADLDAAALSMSKITTPKGRGNRIAIGKTVLVDDSYNANPVSMAYALESLIASRAKKKVALLGEMFELGDASDSAHLALQAQCQGLDRVITVGDRFLTWKEGFFPAGVWQHFASAAEIPLAELVREITKGSEPVQSESMTPVPLISEILIKGSNKVFWAYDFACQVEACLRTQLD